MQTTIDTHTAIDRYLVMFNETDHDVRTELGRELWADDGRLVDPLVDALGLDQIVDAIGELQAQMPGHSLVRTTVVDAHHDHARFGWAVADPDGVVALAGIDVVTFAPDGRMRSAIGFFGDPEAA